MAIRDRRRRRRPQNNCYRPLIEELEQRLTPSVTAQPTYVVMPHSGAEPSSGTGPGGGFTPLQILEGYSFYSTSGTNNISFNGVAGNGAGQTIAIVDAYNDPNITSDLTAFDSEFSLPAPPSFKVLNQEGHTTGLPGVDSYDNYSWEVEESLDVEWAHAMAPDASIDLVEASITPTNGGNLLVAVQTAADLPGVSVVSMSWGFTEFSGETTYDSYFTTPSGHQPVTFIASTGDDGTPGGYPAYSPNVVAAGGTSLYLNSNNSYDYETGWDELSNNAGAGGGGASSYEIEPSYQDSVQSTGYRTTPDISFDADPYTGVSIYDSYHNPYGGPWIAIGGTSVSAPCLSGMMAIIDQGRVATHGTTLNGAAQTLPGLYSLPSGAFHDVTMGSNGTYSAVAGYDEATGIGTPVGNVLVSDMVAYDNVPYLVDTTPPPAAVAAGGSFGFSDTVDVGTTVDTSFSGNVTVSLASNPGGSTLSGSQLTVPVSNGVATFSGLSLNNAGAGYTLSVSGTSLTATATSSFNVETVPVVTLNSIATPTNNDEPTFSGTDSTATGDLSTITINIYSGGTVTGTPFEILTTTASGSSYSIAATTALSPDGVYTAQASQSDSAGQTGTSSTTTFTVDTNTITTTSLTDDGPNPTVAGTAVSYTVSTTGVPNGSTVYLEDANNSNAVVGSIVVSGGSGSTTVSSLSIGTHDVFAVYTGATGYTSSQSSQLPQTVSPIQVSGVAVNGDYIAISAVSDAGQTVTVTTDGLNGFTAGSQVVIAGETGSAAGYNGTWTILSASGDTFTYTNSATGLPTLAFNANGYAISTNTSSSLRGSQRSMVDSVAYTFNAPVNLTANAVTLALKSGITVSGSNTMATGAANVNWTSLSGGKTWVMTFSSASGNTVTGHSIADGVYTLSLNSADVTAVAGGSAMTTTRATDTFYRLYGDTNGQQRVSNADLLAFNNCYAQEAPSASYLAALDYNADGRVNNTDLLAFNNHYSAYWTGFTSTI